MRTFHDRIILVDGQETYFLAHFICDSGIAIEVSGPETLYFHEHEFKELDGSELDLNKGK